MSFQSLKQIVHERDELRSSVSTLSSALTLTRSALHEQVFAPNPSDERALSAIEAADAAIKACRKKATS